MTFVTYTIPNTTFVRSLERCCRDPLGSVCILCPRRTLPLQFHFCRDTVSAKRRPQALVWLPGGSAATLPVADVATVGSAVVWEWRWQSAGNVALKSHKVRVVSARLQASREGLGMWCHCVWLQSNLVCSECQNFSRCSQILFKATKSWG